jgi:hypothetical protein
VRWAEAHPMRLKVDVGPGYRMYYIRRGRRLIILVCGGDKSAQQADIRKARQIAGDGTSRHARERHSPAGAPRNILAAKKRLPLTFRRARTKMICS